MSKLIFYGGLGEIGGNKILLEDNNCRLMLDFGLSYDKLGCFYNDFLQPRTNSILRDLLSLNLTPKIDGIYRQDLLKFPGIEKLPPDLQSSGFFKYDLLSYTEYEKKYKTPFLKAVLVTHAHFDHCKFIAFLDPAIQIICSPVTKVIMQLSDDITSGGLLNESTIFKERYLAQTSVKSTFPDTLTIKSADEVLRKICTIKDYEELVLDKFKIKSYPVDHSIPGSVAYLITTSDNKKIFYTGDLRFHGKYQNYTKKLKEEIKDLNPDALIIEGTRIDEVKPDSEEEVKSELINVISKTKDLVLVEFGWKDITRFNTLLEASVSAGRTLVISAKLAYLLMKLHGYAPHTFINPADLKNVKVYLKRRESMLYSLDDYSTPKYLAGYLNDWGEKAVLMKEAMQMESLADEFLKKALAHYYEGVRAYQIKEQKNKFVLQISPFELNELLDLAPLGESIYIRASSEPFTEEMELDENRLINWLNSFGINKQNCGKPYQIHASGHASQKDLLEFINLMNPKKVFPIHTKRPDIFKKFVSETEIPQLGKEYLI